MTIWWLPLEPLEQRYTAQMDRWVQAALDRKGLPWHRIVGKSTYAKIENGQWLDTIGTARWKIDQVSEMIHLIQSGEVKSGDTVLCGDVWFPSIETLKQISELLDLDLRFAGWHYAGCFDPHDYLAKTLGRWGRKYELSLIEGVFDAVAYGSPFHMDFVHANACCAWQSMPCGLVWNHEEVAQFKSDDKKKIVAFTHRWADEKRWQEFCYLARILKRSTGWQFAYSTCGAEPSDAIKYNCQSAGIDIVVHATKSDYYRWLATVGIVWSGADQETFGYSFMEAIALGCRVVAPMRCAYPNHFEKANFDPSAYLYDAGDLAGLIATRAAMHAHDNNLDAFVIPEIVSSQYTSSVDAFLEIL